MPFIFTNPLGLLALLTVPVILLIHFLQRKAQVVVVSTLFLLPDQNRQAQRGNKFDRLLNSVPLWMQLLVALLLALILSQPRVINENSTIRVAVVLDSSASMSVFSDVVRKEVENEVVGLQGSTPNVELWVLESDLSKSRIFHGNNLSVMRESLKSWSPDGGAISPSQALRVARSLVGQKGSVMYFTDTPSDVTPYGSSVYAVGKSTPNVGFTGVSYRQLSGDLIWEATIKNYFDDVINTSWKVTYENNTVSEEALLELKPSEVRVIRGIIPPGQKRALVSLSEDMFDFDNVLPLLLPTPKELKIGLAETASKDFAQQIVKNFDNLRLVSVDEDMTLATVSVENPDAGDKNSLVLLQSEEKGNLQALKLVSEDHDLMEGLNWQSLLVQKEERIQPTDSDQVLLWGGENALIMLRKVAEGAKGEQLIFNFSLERSNALQQEAFVLLLYRYLEFLRSYKKEAEVSQTELGQKVPLKNRAMNRTMTMETSNVLGEVIAREEIPAYVDAISPKSVGFYSLTQDGELLLTASNIFADTREADLRGCKTEDKLSGIIPEAEEQESDNTLLWKVFLLIALCALLFSWVNRKARHHKSALAV